MCNVIHLYFKCQHLLRLRRSRCKGTKHKITRTSIRAACTAESFLTIYAQTDCSSCEHDRWESDWSSKLEKARTFLAKLTEKRMLGTDEVSALIKELDDQYYMASWNARNTSHAFKKSVARVNVSDHRTVRSPLTQEVRPEDVVDPTEKEKDWTEMDENDYDGNYVAGTDPIHPVSTDYSRPLDDDDGSWILNHFSPEEMESQADVLDFDQTGWSWGKDDSDDTIPIVAASQEENTTKIEDNDLIAWGPEAEASSMLADISMDGLSIKEKYEKERIELVIEAFWTVVNNPTNTNQQPQHPKRDLSILLHNLDITPTTSIPNSPSSPSSQTDSQLQWVDGPSTTLPTSHSTSSTLSQSSPPTRPPTPPSPNSTRTAYDKQRKFLKKRLQVDANKAKYYSDLLLVSRWEARAFEGPEGRFVPDPPMLRKVEGRGRNGWFQ